MSAVDSGFEKKWKGTSEDELPPLKEALYVPELSTVWKTLVVNARELKTGFFTSDYVRGR